MNQYIVSQFAQFIDWRLVESRRQQPDKKISWTFHTLIQQYCFKLMRLLVQPLRERPLISGAVGLENLGNTCFLNSVLQALASTPSLKIYLKDIDSISRLGLTDKRYLQLTSNMLGCMEALRNSTSVDNTKVSLIYQQLSRYRRSLCDKEQQDAEECLQALLSMLSLELTEAKRKSMSKTFLFGQGRGIGRTGPRDGGERTSGLIAGDEEDEEASGQIPSTLPFEGWISSTVTCAHCQTSRPLKHQTFVDLSLPLHAAAPAASSTASAMNSSVNLLGLRNLSEPNSSGIFTGVSGPSLSGSFSAAAAQSIATSGFDGVVHMAGGGPPRCLSECMQRFSAGESVPEVECLQCSYLSQVDSLKMLLKSSWAENTDNAKDVQALKDKLRELEQSRFIASKMESLISGPQRVRANATKQLQISRLPQVLCFHLSRRTFCEKTGRMVKLRHHVAFPLELDMSEYMGTTPLCSPKSQQDRRSGAGSTGRSHRSCGQYSLTAVIVHEGDADSGHYTTFALVDKAGAGEEPMKQWMHFSDERVSPVSVEEVLRSEAYILFYDGFTHE